MEAQRRAAAQAAYDRSMAALNNSYNTMKNGLNSNYDSTLGQLEQNYNTGVSGVNKQADNAQQQAYINYMMNKRDMGQQLAAQGLSGGASESALAGMYNNYGNSRNTIDSGRNDSLADLMNDWNTNKASALQAYNNQLSEMEMQKANAVQQLENNLANLIAQAAADNYNTQFSLTNEYLNRMLDLAGNCALPGFVDSKNEEKTERNAGYLVVSHSGGGMLRQGTRKGIRRTPANRGMRAHWVVKGLDISEDVCHGMCP